MIKTVKARFSNGALTPLEALELQDGEDVTTEIKTAPSPKRLGLGLKASAGAWKGTHDPEELKRMIYEARGTGSREEPAG